MIISMVAHPMNNIAFSAMTGSLILFFFFGGGTSLDADGNEGAGVPVSIGRVFRHHLAQL